MFIFCLFHADWRWTHEETPLWPSLQERTSFTSVEGQMVCSGHAKKSGTYLVWSHTMVSSADSYVLILYAGLLQMVCWTEQSLIPNRSLRFWGRVDWKQARLRRAGCHGNSPRAPLVPDRFPLWNNPIWPVDIHCVPVWLRAVLVLK